jgi:hypothetical protein
MRQLAAMVSAAAVAASALALVPGARADLITNGDFQAQAGGADYVGTSISITGWTVSGQRVVVNSEGNSDPDPSSNPLAAVFDNGTSSSTPQSSFHTGAISQTISTTAGTKYFLTYDFAGFNNNLPQSLKAEVIGASPLATQTYAQTQSIFGTHTIAFTANSASTTIKFSDATPHPNNGGTTGEDGLNDGLLDNVHLNVNNNPSSVNVVNSSFENYNADANTFQGVRTPNSNPAARLVGWYTPAGNNPLVIDDTNNSRIQSGKSGTQFVQYNNTATTMDQVLSTLVTDHTDYSLTVAIGVSYGDFNAGFLSQGASLQLFAQDPNGVLTFLDGSAGANGVNTKSITGATINSGVNTVAHTGALLDYNLTIASGNVAPSLYGQQLVLRINSLYSGGNSENIFDNVRVAIPEPASIGVLALGGLLGCRHRRSRRAS